MAGRISAFACIRIHGDRKKLRLAGIGWVMGRSPPPDKFIIDSYAEELGELASRLSPSDWEWVAIRRFRKWLVYVEKAWTESGMEHLDAEDVIQLARLKEEYKEANGAIRNSPENQGGDQGS